MSRSIAFALCAMLLSSAVAAGAQDTDSLAAQYGRGVHAYFAGDYAGARRELTRAIEAGSQDPRCHYFRALALVRLGETDKVEVDMARGAELEVLDRDGYYPVSRSLERVQGRDRLRLETHRQRARQAAGQRALEQNRRRYEQLRRAEGEVLRQPLRVPLERLAEDLQGSPAVAGGVPLDPAKLPGGSKPAGSPVADGGRDPFAMPSEPAAAAVENKVKATTLGRVLSRIFRRSIGAVSGTSGQAPDATDARLNELFDDGAAANIDALPDEDLAPDGNEAAPADDDNLFEDKDPFGDDAPSEDDDPFGEVAPAEDDVDVVGDDEPGDDEEKSDEGEVDDLFDP